MANPQTEKLRERIACQLFWWACPGGDWSLAVQRDYFLKRADAILQTCKEAGLTEENVVILAKALQAVLIEAGIVREDAIPTIPELIMAAEEYCGCKL